MGSISSSTTKHYNNLKSAEVKTEVRSAGSRGKGLFASQKIKKGSVIIEYIGELIDEAEYLRRYDQYKSQSFHHDYFASLNENQILDATRLGNHGRFGNHSCDPNAFFDTIALKDSNVEVLFIFASKNIKEGEEITLSYDLSLIHI